MIDEKKLIEEIKEYTLSVYGCDINDIVAFQTNNESELTYIVQGICESIDFIKQQEKVGEWIPVSERLPKPEGKNEWVKCDVTVIRSHWPTSSYDYCDSPYDEFYVTEAMYNVSQKIWNLSNEIQLNALIDIEDAPLNGDYVIAWQPLPEPYKEKQQ